MVLLDELALYLPVSRFRICYALMSPLARWFLSARFVSDSAQT